MCLDGKCRVFYSCHFSGGAGDAKRALRIACLMQIFMHFERRVFSSGLSDDTSLHMYGDFNFRNEEAISSITYCLERTLFAYRLNTDVDVANMRVIDGFYSFSRVSAPIETASKDLLYAGYSGTVESRGMVNNGDHLRRGFVSDRGV
jgi:hypothetical protein